MPDLTPNQWVGLMALISYSLLAVSLLIEAGAL
jgi:hypothetical protein